MSALRRRLERLEALEKPPERDEDAERKMWLATARFRRAHEKRNPDEFHTGDVFRTLRMQGKLAGASYEEALESVLAWPPPPDRGVAERVLSKMVHDREEGTEGMECPPEWGEAWEAADELRERHAAVPLGTLARWMVTQHDIDEGGPYELAHEAAHEMAVEREAHGLTDELCRAAVGPDAEEITQDEQARRLREILADFYYGERAWEVQQEIYAMATERNREDG